MTPKQRKFVDEYLIDTNATQAAIRAGYSPKTAAFIASENLKKPYISREIELAMNERSERTKVTADRVVKEAASVAFLDPAALFAADGSLLPIGEMPAAARAAIASFDVVEITDGDGQPVGRVKKVRLVDKLGALTLLARHLGMLQDKIKLQGDAENPLTLLIQSIQGSSVRPVPTHALPNPGDGDD